MHGGRNLDPRLTLFLAGLVVWASLGAAHAAQTDPFHEEATPLIVRVLASPVPVPTSDGALHLAYEIAVTNTLNVPLRVTGIDVLDPERGNQAVARFGEAELAGMIRSLGSLEFSSEILPGVTAALWVDVPLERDADVPSRLVHRFHTDFDASQARGLPTVRVQIGAEVAVGGPLLVVGPPLRGSKWLVMNGCCMPVTNHRGAVLPINGDLYAAERYAIDFIQLDDQDRFVSGDPTAIDGYAFYGAEILSVADGSVVRVFDEVEEHDRVGALSYPITMETIGGNYVIIEIGEGLYAFYAHLEPGSVTAKPGDRVRRGDVIATLGNTGNSTMPHLHFHIINVPLALGGNGIAYVFDNYELRGYLSPENEEEVLYGAPVIIDPAPAAFVQQRETLPLDGALIDFPGN